jgi:hypothetical protein
MQGILTYIPLITQFKLLAFHKYATGLTTQLHPFSNQKCRPHPEYSEMPSDTTVDKNDEKRKNSEVVAMNRLLSCCVSPLMAER